jgi:hypothetical protein
MKFFGRKPSANSKPEVDYAEIGKQFIRLSDTVNPDRLAVYRTSFLKGVAGGVGGVVGATLVITLLAWLLSLFDSLPFVGDYVEATRNSLQKK